MRLGMYIKNLVIRIAHFLKELFHYLEWWNIALSAVVIAAVVFSGLEYSRNIQEKQLLLAVTSYAQEEGARISADGNPFRTGAAAEENPFTGIIIIDESKPAAIRR